MSEMAYLLNIRRGLFFHDCVKIMVTTCNNNRDFPIVGFRKNKTNLLILSVWLENWAAMFPVLSASQ